ncbi:oxidoreductase [Spirochaeta lutea]|uniref:NADH:flavin oxidoreductase/NADH oxidase N-terminal domain-containing protein n=1 Tax=Spirochaeta lutea TaxID=1480694 RepID=A0A098QV34_9SPIO|nr:NADPH dehydrogenase [Spirochaeta lutea]KGE71273.1 hypothetical protein DC28_12605 [Spirochaeta lutea]
MPTLFEPVSLGTMKLRNRVIMAPMCMYSCPEKDGKAGDFHVMHYAARSYGGVGLVLLEATGVHPQGRISEEDLGLWQEDQIPGLQRVVRAIHAGGAKAGIQLGHAGRKSRATPDPVAPSALAFNASYPQPRELSPGEIEQIAGDFGSAARRAVEAGFDCVEIHGAHGYLISEFLSPLCNRRHDDYGRDRLLFLERVLDNVRRSVPEGFPLILRISAEDYAPGGNNPETLGELLGQGILDRYGISALHVSSGGVVDSSIQPYPGYQIPMAETIQECTGAPVIAGGLIQSPEHAESIVAQGRGEFIFLGRALLRDPHWCLRAAHELGAEIPWPTPYRRGRF